MNNEPSFHKRKPIFFFLIISFLASFFLPSEANAQKKEGEEETIELKIKVKNKEQQLKFNSNGYFDLVWGVQSSSQIPITVMYPKGKPGDKVILTSQHNGSFDNQKLVKVVQLDHQKKCSFTFQTTRDPGLYEITLRKGDDTKVLQLWVNEK